MRAVIQYGTGGPDVLKLENRPRPQRQPGEVLIRALDPAYATPGPDEKQKFPALKK